ncbi:MAG: class I SAM-dependent methyltransferase [Mariprofundaceae bacterium]
MSDDRSKWNSKYSMRGEILPQPPADFLSHCADMLLEMLPKQPSVLDLAAGEGRNALFLASRGCNVDAVDISLEGLQRAKVRAEAQNLTLRPINADLDHFPMPESQYDLILNFFFLKRDLFPTIIKALKPGGLLMFETYTIKHQADNKGRNMNPLFLLKPEELKEAFPMFEVLVYQEQEATARLLARKPS